MKVLGRLLLAAITVAGSGTALATDDTDHDKLQGRWKVVEVTPNDEDGKQAIGTILVFGPEKMLEESAEAKKKKSEGGKYRLDPTKKPSTLTSWTMRTTRRPSTMPRTATSKASMRSRAIA